VLTTLPHGITPGIVFAACDVKTIIMANKKSNRGDQQQSPRGDAENQKNTRQTGNQDKEGSQSTQGNNQSRQGDGGNRGKRGNRGLN